MNINDKIREVAKETEALVEENKKLEERLRIQRHLKEEYMQIAHEAIMKGQGLIEPKDGLRTEVEDIAHTLNGIAKYLRVADESVLKQYSLASDGNSSTEELVLTNGMTVTIERESNYKEDKNNENN